ncbi:CLUMA_CG007659, isoform A [Clunio marinus]|uniref:CLUMA_CG007659, isoform A n=1 Tax=Clunio marinus TaxID=568069 RepID=A0A1J1I3G8_9DIPT|nr:CLUMA_CG007659, isoform A [Clunio marinus]
MIEKVKRIINSPVTDLSESSPLNLQSDQPSCSNSENQIRSYGSFQPFLKFVKTRLSFKSVQLHECGRQRWLFNKRIYYAIGMVRKISKKLSRDNECRGLSSYLLSYSRSTLNL